MESDQCSWLGPFDLSIAYLFEAVLLIAVAVTTVPREVGLPREK
jgi:hypothetical protein